MIHSSPANSGHASLPESYRTVSVEKVGWLRKFLAFAGPGYLVSVGYMDPGNWATDLAGGSRYGYTLLWVILVSNLMAMFLQTLCARLGIVTGKDLAQSCRDYYKKPAAVALWLLCELAIVACDLAEVIGSAVALQLLFGIPLLYGVLVTGLDVLLLLGLMRFGFRVIEAIVIALVGTIFLCFAYNIFLAQPDLAAVAHGTFTPQVPDTAALLIAVGILGATVMPHNLYLHSSVVQTRAFEQDPEGKKEAVRHSTLDVVIALGAAFFVNAAILVLAAAVFNKTGRVVEELQDAHKLLSPMLGGASATLFAVALLASGQSSTMTGTLAGQIVMEGFLHVRVKPWVRRLVTRGLAIVPAMLIVTASGGENTVQALILSQVVLSMQLPFAVIPLLMITSDKKRMGTFVSPLWMTITGVIIATTIIYLNAFLLWKEVGPVWVLSGAALIAAFAAWVHFGYRGRSKTPVPVQP